VRSASLLPPSALSRPLTVAAANGGRPEPPPTPPSRSWLATAATAVGSAALLAAALLAPAPALADAATFPGFRAAPTTSASLTAVRGPAAAEADLAPDELATVRLFQGATPSVVNIANLQQVSSYSSLDAQSVPVGTGSGFVWDAEGHIVTNFHVVRGASSIKVALIDASVYPATFIAGDADKDVAVLKLEAPPDVIARLTPASLGASANLLVGQKVFAIGNPCVWGWRRVERGGRRWPPLRTWPTPPRPPRSFGLDHSLSQGVVSGLGRELASPGMRGVPIKGVIQCDAAVNREREQESGVGSWRRRAHAQHPPHAHPPPPFPAGNSGGPLLDSKGRVIGINTAIADPTGRGSSSGVGFAIPIDTVRGLVEQILTYGRVVRPVLGITIAPPQTLRQLGEEGVLILDVPKGTPAFKAGLRGTYRDAGGRVVLGDVIKGVDGHRVRTQRDLFEALDERRPGDKIQVDVSRDGRAVGVGVVLGGRELGRME
jgi:S1-C subfamily serine protease